MLTLDNNRSNRKFPWFISSVVVFLGGSGLYVLALASAPAVMPYINKPTVDAKSLPKPENDKNRLIIPKLGVDISYSSAQDALNSGAQWLHPDRGSPTAGGNFVLAAHRFGFGTTPSETYEKSPFYNINKLEDGDQIIVDYDGSRYGYEINKKYDVKPTQTEIEAASSKPKLTMYSCTLAGSDDGRIVIEAEPLGKVDVAFNS